MAVNQGVLLLILVVLGCHVAANPAVADIKEAIEAVKSYRAAHGVAPSFVNSELDKTFSYNEIVALYGTVVEEQRPAMSLEDLLGLLESKRDSIRSFECEYNTLDGGRNVFAFDAEKIFIEEAIPGDQRVGTQISTYDGELRRHVYERPNQLTNASIEPTVPLASFYRHQMPLCKAMMFNTALTGGYVETADIVRFLSPETDADAANSTGETRLKELTDDADDHDEIWVEDTAPRAFAVVFEELQLIDGRKCLMLGNLTYDIFLDVEYGFALRRLDVYERSSTATPARKLVRRRDNVDFHDYGNGIWIPHKSTLLEYTDLEPKRKQCTTVVSMKVNPHFEEGFFSDPIPEDAVVADGVREMVYEWRDRASINSLISRTVPEKRNRRTFLLINIIAIAIVVLVVRRKMHGEVR